MTPWTKAFADKLRGADYLVTFALLGVIAVTTYVLVIGKPRSKALLLGYILLP